jgi:hypothetical protein
MLRVAFYTSSKGFYESLISIFAGIPTHCELLFSDGLCFSSSNRDGGIRFKKIDLNPDKWLIINVPKANESQARAYCEYLAEQNSGYDYLGILLGWLGIHSKRRWFCSEVTARVLQESGVALDVDPETVSPYMLYEELVNRKDN